MKTGLYSDIRWRRLRKRALERDDNRCTYARLFGGECSARLDVHHKIPISEGGPEFPDLAGLLTLCSAHHPMLEKLRRILIDTSPVTSNQWKTCPHMHRTSRSRIECELRLNKRLTHAA